MKRTRTFEFGESVYFDADDDGIILKCFKGHSDNQEKVMLLNNNNPAVRFCFNPYNYFLF